MSYVTTASLMFDSAATSVRHTSVAGNIVSALSYIDMDDHAEKTAECNKLLASLQAEADRRKPVETNGFMGKLSTAAADHKVTVANVARYFATSAGHIYRREIKNAMQRAVNAIAAGAAQPENEKDAILFVADFVEPRNVPFIGVKKGNFIAEYESLRSRFIRLSTGAYERRQKADEAAVQLAQLRQLLAENGIEIDGLEAVA